MSRIFLTADTHFGHRNIVKHCDRPFSSVEEMDEALIGKWNSVVGPDDVVWHLGDFAWKDHLKYKARLNGKINWVLGNHDKCSVAVREQFTSVQQLHTGTLFSNLRLGQADEVGLVERRPQFVFLFHYPCVTWFGKGRGAYHFYGHVHGRYTKRGEKSLDVGVDARNFFPIELNDAFNLADQNAAAEPRSAEQI